MIHVAQQNGLPHVDVRASTLHRRVGDYPNPHRHRMPVCCEVMRQTMQAGDTILHAPLKGDGASLTITDCCMIC
jgi:hypothetical protein